MNEVEGPSRQRRRHRCTVPPLGAGSIAKEPPASRARSRSLTSPLPVISPEIPRPLSMTSMDNSSSTLTLMLSGGGAGVPDSLLTASRTAASA